jgi:secretion/DNA translocation related TadE-like protein
VRDRGAGTVIVIGLMAVALTAGLATVAAGQIVVARSRAITAADAAALAAAVHTFPPAGGGPVAAARSLAARNGARLLSCRCSVDPTLQPRSVEVRVEVVAEVILVGAVRVAASSRAEYLP